MDMSNSAAPEAEEVKKPKVKKVHDTVPVRYIATLTQVCGTHAEAARRIGLTGSVVTKALKDGIAKRVNELAAKAVLSEIHSTSIFTECAPDEAMGILRSYVRDAQAAGWEFYFDGDRLVGTVTTRQEY